MKAIEIKQKSLERKAAMLKMSQNGLTYAQIGTHFGIGAQRVGELIRSYTRKSLYPKSPLQAELSTRTANALRSEDFKTKQEVLNAWEAGYDFTAISNLGRNSLEEIREWLGYPKDEEYTPNWDDAPPEATWASFDSQGNVHWYIEKPKINKRP
jgi:transposase